MKHLLFVVPLVILAILYISCSEDDYPVNIPISVSIESIDAQTKMALGSDYFHQIRVVLAGSTNEINVEACIVNTTGDTLGQFELFDDAGATIIDDSLPYTDSHSGDVAAGDGIFSIRLNSLFTSSEIEVQMVVSAVNSEAVVVDADSFYIEVYENQAPVVSNPNLPAVLTSGFPAFNLEVTVTDAQGYGDIASVRFAIAILGELYTMSDPESDGIFSYYLGPEFAAGKYPGQYTFEFSAVDSLGMVSNILYEQAYIENGTPLISAPSIFNEFISSDGVSGDSLLTIPDPGDTLDVFFTVEINDPQTLADIDLVFMNIARPGSGWNNDEYPLVDNGFAWNLDSVLVGEPYFGDQTAGDGIFSTTRLYTSSVASGLHEFYFQCKDRIDQPADSVSVGLRFTN